jgi:hypothetical protein
MTRIFEDGPNVVNLSLEDAYFFVMNMFVHDPCIHDFSLQGLGSIRTDRAGSHCGGPRVASMHGGGVQVGGDGESDIKFFIDSSMNELLDPSKQENVVAGVEKKSTICDITEVLKGILPGYNQYGIGIATLNELQKCLEVHYPGITGYTIFDIGTSLKGVTDKFSREVVNKYSGLQQGITDSERDVSNEEANFVAMVENKEKNEEIWLANENFRNIIRIIEYAKFKDDITRQDIEDINKIYKLETNAVKRQEIYNYLHIHLSKEMAQAAVVSGGGYKINNVNNNYIQKGGAWNYSINSAKVFVDSILYFKKPDARINGTWIITPYEPPDQSPGAVPVKFENDFAIKLIRAIKYFKPDATDADFIKTTISNGLNKTTFKLEDGLLETVYDVISSRIQNAYNKFNTLELKDLPSNTFKNKIDDSFYLYRTTVKNIDPDATNFYSKLTEIFSNEMFDSVSIDNNNINDDNDAIKVLFFLYEITNILIIYNYIHFLKTPRIQIEKQFGLKEKQEGRERIWNSIAGIMGSNGNIANSMRTRVSDMFNEQNDELRYGLDIILNKIGDARPVKDEYLTKEGIMDNCLKYIDILKTESEKTSPPKSGSLGEREANIIDFCLDTVVHSVVTPLKSIRDSLDSADSPKLTFYDAFVGPGNNRKYRAGGKDKIIMNTFLNTFFPTSGPPHPSVQNNYTESLVDGIPQDPIKYGDKSDAKTIAMFDDSLKNTLIAKLKTPASFRNQNIVYINNAAQNIYHGRDDVGTTNIASVIDPQKTFPKFKTKGGNKELSDMDITIKTSDIKTSNNQIFYRVRVTVTDYNKQDGDLVVKIEAYLKIGEEVLIFKEDPDEGFDLTGLKATEPITVSTSNKNPLQANNCYYTLVKTVTDLFNKDEQRTNASGVKDRSGKIHSNFVYKFLCDQSGNDFTYWHGKPFVENPEDEEKYINPKECRRQIIEASFQKGLGDFLQEVLGWAPNRGYTGSLSSPGREAFAERAGNIYNLKAPSLNNLIVIQLNNDTPSGLRGLFFNDMRSNPGFWQTPPHLAPSPGNYSSICGYLSNASFITVNNGEWTKQWYPRYAVSIYPPPSSGGGGGKKKKKQKTRKKRRVKYSTIRRKGKKTRRSRRRQKNEDATQLKIKNI